MSKDRFADDASKRMCIRAELFINILPRYFKKYLDCNSWEGRNNICIEALNFIELCSEEKFDSLPSFSINMDCFSFENKKLQKAQDNIWDIFYMATAFKTLFENQKECCLSHIDERGSYFYCNDMKSDLSFIIKASKFPRVWQDEIQLPLEPLEALNKRLFELPIQDNNYKGGKEK